MRKAKSLLGLNLVSQLEGKNLGTIRDLIFDNSSHKLIALLLTDRNLFGFVDATVVPWTQVREIGPHAIMVPSEEVVLKAHADPIIAEAYDQKNQLDGKKVTTQGGEDLGRVSDLYLDEQGRVQGFEVSGGLFSDATHGKRYMEMPGEITVGEDVILVPQEIATELERQRNEEPGGLVASTAPLAARAGELFDSAKAKVGETYDNIADASVDKQREYVIGKVASRDVVLPAAQATMATPEAITTDRVSTASALPAATTTTPLDATTSTSGTTSTGLVSTGPVSTGPVSTGPAETLHLAPGESVVVRPSETSGSTTSTTTSTSLASTQVPELHNSTYASATDVSSTGEVVDGEVLVRKGETITAAHADRAISAGILHQLVLAAGGTQAGQVGEGAEDKLEEAAIGKPAGREVMASDGSVIVAPGMIVTRAILDRADRDGKKGQVIAAAGLGAASEGAQNTLGSVKESAGGIWDTIKEKAAELTGSAQDKKAEYDERAEQNKINNALGRPTTRVILAPDDTVILNTGDLITNAAVNHARQAGVLPILLDSVFTAEPEITPEMLRAQGKGADALPSQAIPSGGPITATIAPGQPTQTAQTTPEQGSR